MQVRGDLGIAVAFEQRARAVLDARVTGTQPGEPWRILLLPQPEKICLQYRIDALGIHEIGLYQLDQALDSLAGWLPGGRRADPDHTADPDSLLASAERSALVTVTRYTAQGSAETAGASTDLILARHDGRLHVLTRDPADRARLDPRPSGRRGYPRHAGRAAHLTRPGRAGSRPRLRYGSPPYTGGKLAAEPANFGAVRLALLGQRNLVHGQDYHCCCH